MFIENRIGAKKNIQIYTQLKILLFKNLTHFLKKFYYYFVKNYFIKILLK